RDAVRAQHAIEVGSVAERHPLGTEAAAQRGMEGGIALDAEVTLGRPQTAQDFGGERARPGTEFQDRVPALEIDRIDDRARQRPRTRRKGADGGRVTYE